MHGSGRCAHPTAVSTPPADIRVGGPAAAGGPLPVVAADGVLLLGNAGRVLRSGRLLLPGRRRSANAEYRDVAGSLFLSALVHVLAPAAELLGLGIAAVLASRHLFAVVFDHGRGSILLAPRPGRLDRGGSGRRRPVCLLENASLYAGLDRRRNRRFRRPVLRPRIVVGRRLSETGRRRRQPLRPASALGHRNHVCRRADVQGVVRGLRAGVFGVDCSAEVYRPAAAGGGGVETHRGARGHCGGVSSGLEDVLRREQGIGGATANQSSPRRDRAARQRDCGDSRRREGPAPLVVVAVVGAVVGGRRCRLAKEIGSQGRVPIFAAGR